MFKKHKDDSQDKIKRLEAQVASLQQYNQSLQDKAKNTEGTLENFFLEKYKSEEAIAKILGDFQEKSNKNHLICGIDIKYKDLYGKNFWVGIKLK